MSLMAAPVRRYQMTRVRSGEYLLPSNDGTTLWRIYTYEEDGSWSYEVAPGKEREVRGTFWAVAKYDGISLKVAIADPDLLEWDQWALYAGPLNTRREAIDTALRASS